MWILPDLDRTRAVLHLLPPGYFFYFCFYFKTKSHSVIQTGVEFIVTQAGLEHVVMILPQPLGMGIPGMNPTLEINFKCF